MSTGHILLLGAIAGATIFLGLPIGRDMDGNARPDLFQAAFTADRPITFIPTYER